MPTTNQTKPFEFHRENALPAETSQGFHLVRWIDEEETHFGAMRVTWGRGTSEEWQLVGEDNTYSRSELLNLIGTAVIESWEWIE